MLERRCFRTLHYSADRLDITDSYNCNDKADNKAEISDVITASQYETLISYLSDMMNEYVFLVDA